MRQNIVLMYEENYDKRVVSSKMVNLYMNRFTIDEDAQAEIVGIEYLEAYNFTTNRIPYHSRVDKLNRDIETFCSALQKVQIFTEKHNFTHFIIGSMFYMDFIPQPLPKYYGIQFLFDERYPYNQLHPIEALIVNIYCQLRYLDLKTSCSFTFLSGVSFTLSKVLKLS